MVEPIAETQPWIKPLASYDPEVLAAIIAEEIFCAQPAATAQEQNEFVPINERPPNDMGCRPRHLLDKDQIY